jgi:hypothetical protein
MAADENEEFEFRLRAEREAVPHRAVSPAQKLDPTEGMSGLGKFAAGAGKAFADVGRGIQQVAAMGPLNEEGRQRQAQVQESIDEAKKLDAPLMASGAGKTGYVAGGLAAMAPTALVPGAGTLAGATALGAAQGALQPVASDESRASNVLMGGASGAVGKVAGDVASAGLGAIAGKLGRARAPPVATEAGALMDKGYKLPPSYAKVAGAKPSVLDDMLEGFGGKIKTEQKFSAANQENTNRLVRSALGLTEGEEISKARLAQVREDAGQVYEAVKNYRGRFDVDPQFDAGMQKIGRSTTPVSSPERAKLLQGSAQIKELVDNIRSAPSFNPEEAIETVKQLRLDGKANIKGQADIKSLGRAQLQAADEIDGLISRTLARDKNAAGLFQAYKEARTLIAKSYDVEKALNDASHNVSAQKLARIAQKSRMTGKLKDVVDFAGKYEGIARTVEQRGSRMGPEHSPLDYAAAGAMALHHPAAGAAFLARPLARKYMLSEMGQRSMLPQAARTVEQRYLPRSGAIAGTQLLESYREEE